MKNKQRGNALLGLIILIVVVLAGAGWIKNIIKLVAMPGIEGHVGEFVVRLVGIIPFVGAIVGWF